MNIEYQKWKSPNLDHSIELKVYGHFGQPILVFPSSQGRFYQYEDFGMVDACKPYIESGKIKIFAVDSIDWQSWWSDSIHPSDKGRRHNDYENYILQEVVPLIYDHCRTKKIGILTHGVSFGAYHAVNFFLKHPDKFSGTIALSGKYNLEDFTEGFVDDNIYFNDPLMYLKNMDDDFNDWFLSRYRQSKIILCAGQGAFEEQFLSSSKALSVILTEKNVPHWLDIWGLDVFHDWPWWQKQIYHFLKYL